MGSQVFYRIFGDIFRISPLSAEMLQDRLPFEQVTISDGNLHFEHEGGYIDMEEALELIATGLTEKSSGKIDFIDTLEWEMTRFEITGREIGHKRIDLNNALEKYMFE
ncbi:MAG: hypothetical protein ACLFTB_04470 [Desulfovibrionales bacterium]